LLLDWRGENINYKYFINDCLGGAMTGKKEKKRKLAFYGIQKSGT
jgi:hypothetical protein